MRGMNNMSMSPEEQEDRRATQKVLTDFGRATESLVRISGGFKNLEATRKDIQKTVSASGMGISAGSVLKQTVSEIVETRSGLIGGIRRLREETVNYNQRMMELQSRIIDPSSDTTLQGLTQKRAELGGSDPSSITNKVIGDSISGLDEQIAARQQEIAAANESAQMEMGAAQAGGGAAMAHPAAMVAVAVVAALKKVFDEFMGPGIELSKSLKSAGMPKLVNAFNIAAEPLVQVMDLVGEMFVPVFLPMMTKISEAVVNKLPEIQKVVDDMIAEGTFDKIADSAVRSIEYLPEMLKIWVDFAGLNWSLMLDNMVIWMPAIIDGLNAVNSSLTILTAIQREVAKIIDQIRRVGELPSFDIDKLRDDLRNPFKVFEEPYVQIKYGVKEERK